MNDSHDTQPSVPDAPVPVVPDLAKAEPLFDALRSRAASRAARNTFDNRLKRAERTVFLYLYGLAAAAVWAVESAIGTTSLKAGLFYGLVVLLAIETSVLIKLWYWIVNTKISLMKDMKQLRLHVGRGGASASASATGEDDEPSRSPTGMTLSKRERWTWLAGLVVVIVVVDILSLPTSLPELASAAKEARTMQCERTVAIQPDGSGAVSSRYSIPNDRLFPMERFQAFTERPDGLRPNFSDFTGRELTTIMQPITENDVHGEWLTVTLPELVMPGQRLFLKESTNEAKCAEKQGGVWKFRDEELWNYGENVFSYRYSCRVELPVGAKLLSVKPRFVSSHHDEGPAQGRWTVVEFYDRKPRNVPFRVEVEYALP